MIQPSWEDLYQTSSPGSPSSDASSKLLMKCRKVCDEASKTIINSLSAYNGHQQQERRSNKKSGDDTKPGHSYSRKRETTKSPPVVSVLVNSVGKAEAALEAEKQLWIQLKQFKDSNDRNVISFINGFYVTLLATINMIRKQRRSMVTDGQEDVLSKVSRSSKKEEVGKIENDLLYNLLIRLGDLNRYLKNQLLAKSYYNEARILNPYRGHAYNQLALISSDKLIQVYYYVRAVCSTQEAILFAGENLKSQITKFAAKGEQSNIVALFIPPTVNPIKPPPGFTSNGSTSNGLNPIPLDVSNVSNWVYMVIVSIYSNNLSLIIEPLFESSQYWINQQLVGMDPFNHSSNFGNSSQFNDYNLAKDGKALLPALDILFDYILCLTTYNQEEQLAGALSEKQKNEQERRKSHVLSAIKYQSLINLKMSITSLLSLSDNFALGMLNTSPLKHDYALLGFSFLSLAHSKLKFEEGIVPTIQKNEFILLVKRINDKIRIIEGIIGKQQQQLSFTGNNDIWNNGQINGTSSATPMVKVRKSRNAILNSLPAS